MNNSKISSICCFWVFLLPNSKHKQKPSDWTMKFIINNKINYTLSTSLSNYQFKRSLQKFNVCGSHIHQGMFNFPSIDVLIRCCQGFATHRVVTVTLFAHLLLLIFSTKPTLRKTKTSNCSHSFCFCIMLILYPIIYFINQDEANLHALKIIYLYFANPKLFWKIMLYKVALISKTIWLLLWVSFWMDESIQYNTKLYSRDKN